MQNGLYSWREETNPSQSKCFTHLKHWNLFCAFNKGEGNLGYLYYPACVCARAPDGFITWGR